MDSMLQEYSRQELPVSYGTLPDQEEQVSPATPYWQSGDEVIDMTQEEALEGYQVVRREYFAHLREPAIVFNNCRFYVNSACLSKFPNASYVQVLVNQERKILALRPCDEYARDSFAWCSINGSGKRKPKQTTCKLFFAKIFSLLSWNPNNRYKILGKLIHAKGEYLIAFDLTATEVYERLASEGKNPKFARTPRYPASWQDQFGMPYKEHVQSLQVDIFDGYAVYTIKDTQNSKAGAVTDSEPAQGPEQRLPVSVEVAEGVQAGWKM